MDWKLLVDNKQTISGVMDSEIIVPGTGQTATIPIKMTLNLMDFFNNLGYEGVVKLALALAESAVHREGHAKGDPRYEGFRDLLLRTRKLR